MKQLKTRYQLNENGISLIEVVATIVILTIVLIGIFSMLTHSAKTTKTSEDIIDATYIAQTEMEELYTHAKTNLLPADLKTFTQNYPDYKYAGMVNGKHTYEHVGTGIYIVLTIIPSTTYNHLTRVIIQVYDQKSDNKVLKAQMENTLEWGS